MATRRKPNPAALDKDAIPEEVIAEAPAAPGMNQIIDEAIMAEYTPDPHPTRIENLDLTAEQMEAETPGRESRWPTITETRSITVPLTEEDLAGKAAEMTEIILERDRTKLRAKNAASAFKAEVEELDERLGTIAHKIDSGGDEKSVACTWVFETFGKDTEKYSRHFPEMPVTTTENGLIFHPEYKTLVRDDNGDVVETALITNHERQMDLSLLHEVPVTEPDPDDIGGQSEDDGAADLLDPVNDPDPDPTPDLFGDETPEPLPAGLKACYDLGYGAFDQECAEEENPYPLDSPEFNAWRDGWRDSKDATVAPGEQ